MKRWRKDEVDKEVFRAPENWPYIWVDLRHERVVPHPKGSNQPRWQGKGLGLAAEGQAEGSRGKCNR